MEGHMPEPARSIPAQALYGLLAQFDSPAQLLHAAQQLRQAGFQHWDVFSPYPVPGMAEAMGLRNSRLSWFAFAGGAVGCVLGLLMVWYMNAHDYPLLVGGKPMFSLVPAVPVAYELSILLGAVGAVLGLLFLNRLPRWYHPLFNCARFRLASRDKFFVVIEATDPRYEPTGVTALLQRLGATHVELVQA